MVGIPSQNFSSPRFSSLEHLKTCGMFGILQISTVFSQVFLDRVDTNWACAHGQQDFAASRVSR